MTDTDPPDEIARSHQRYRDFAKLLVILSTAILTFAGADADYAETDLASVKAGCFFNSYR